MLSGRAIVDVFENALLHGLLRREVDGLDARARNAHHFAGLDFRLEDVLRVEQIERAGFRKRPARLRRQSAEESLPSTEGGNREDRARQ